MRFLKSITSCGVVQMYSNPPSTSFFASFVVFAVDEGKAKMVQVAVQGYSGLQVGIAGPGLEEGQQIVVKGNERLFGGEQLNIRQ